MTQQLSTLVAGLLWLILLSCSSDTEQNLSPTLSTTVHTERTEGYNPNKNVYFGDLHIHTGWSFDAYVSGTRITPDQAYKYGQGEAIPHIAMEAMQLQRPLDFMAVADHAEYMGALMQMADQSSELYGLSIAEKIRSTDKNVVRKAFRSLQLSIGLNWPKKKLIQNQHLQSTWQKMVEAADANYKPGTFTTFPAYEWTSSIGVLRSFFSGPRYAQNMHRNVIFKGGSVSNQPFSSFSSQNPEDLWTWMEQQRERGIELMAIPHNANISDGRMYALTTHDGDDLTAAFAQRRMLNEPVNEVVQIKGQSMSHPLLAPKDEFADFEIYEFALGQGNPRKKLEPNGGFVRQAFKNGLQIESQLGSNPFEFGVIGSSDGHNGGSNIEEDNYVGKSGTKDSTPEVRLKKWEGGEIARRSSVAGLAAVWATENTREAIYSALERKEVYATSGPRIRVRFFASWDWEDLDFDDPSIDSISYARGKPMGSTLASSDQLSSPQFLISTVKDPEGANLDRVQIIKGWVDSNGTHEKIYNVAWSDERTIDEDGQLPPVGSTVDLSMATYTNDIGSTTLRTIWKDPDFDPNQLAFYYLRVIEIPTPRWTTYDAVQLNAPLPDDVASTLQERAWSSPIWFKPNR